jgi:hypothetical protein
MMRLALVPEVDIIKILLGIIEENCSKFQD